MRQKSWKISREKQKYYGNSEKGRQQNVGIWLDYSRKHGLSGPQGTKGQEKKIASVYS